MGDDCGASGAATYCRTPNFIKDGGITARLLVCVFLGLTEARLILGFSELGEESATRQQKEYDGYFNYYQSHFIHRHCLT